MVSTKTAPFSRSLDHELVVDDLVVNVDRRPKFLQRQIQRINCHVDPGTETSGSRQNDFHGCQFLRSLMASKRGHQPVCS